MKLVVYTQIMENYSESGGDYWKAKGGNTYIVENITPRDEERIQETGIPNLTKLIEHGDDYYRETVVDFRFHEDDDKINHSWGWEYSIFLKYNKYIGRWTAHRETPNHVNGYNNFTDDRIEAKVETWDMGDESKTYRSSFKVRDYGIVRCQRIMDVLRQLDEEIA
jgi:hypothetical protein